MLKRNQPMLLERMGKMQSATDAEYCKYDGFDGLKRAISLSDEEILNELDIAHLRGRWSSLSFRKKMAPSLSCKRNHKVHCL